MKSKLAELVKKGQAVLSEMDILGKKMEAEKDEAMKATIKEELDGKKAAFDQIKGKIDEEKAALARRKELASAMTVEKELQTELQGKNLTSAAQALDHQRDERAKREAFLHWIQGKSISGQMRDALAPTSPAFKEGQQGMRLPDSMAAAIFGKSFVSNLAGLYEALSGKTYSEGLPQTTEDPCMVPLIVTENKENLLELPAEPTSILSDVTVIPALKGSANWPVLQQTDTNEYGGVEVDWIEEAAEKPDAEACFEQLSITCYELAAYTELSHTLLRRSIIALEPILTRLFRGAIYDALESAILTSLGAASPTGIVPTAGIRLVGRAVANQVAYIDLVRLKYALRSYHRSGARFALADTVAEFLELSLDGENRPLFTASVANGLYARLVNHPWGSNHRQPPLGHEGDVIFGDFREYILAMEQEVVLRRSEHYKFKNNVEAFSVYMVVGGKVAQPRAFAILDNEVGS